jgi:erythronate-4-phosphate dehydrogenase
MNLLCATSVSLGKEAFSPLGRLTLLPEGDITPEAVREMDAVITRSKTRLNPRLAEGSRLRFAGTCTAGIDHADPEGLAALGVHFASAPGCNANAVSEYVVAALLESRPVTDFRFAGKTIGIIGCGEVGSRVEKKARALGMTVLRNDPPKAARGEPGPWTDLPDLLAEADVITLHVPLVEDGPWPTRALIGERELARTRPGMILINACRGEVTDNTALFQARTAGHLAWLVLDVWDPEPGLPPDLLAAADLASAHIAGHSVEGKVNGTRQIHDALCKHVNIPHPWDPTPLLPPPEHPVVELTTGDFEDRLAQAVTACYDIRTDDRLLRQNPAEFNTLRRSYRDRREFSATALQGCTAEEIPVFRALGFAV